jgi:hypothetical protein
MHLAVAGVDGSPVPSAADSESYRVARNMGAVFMTFRMMNRGTPPGCRCAASDADWLHSQTIGVRRSLFPASSPVRPAVYSVAPVRQTGKGGKSMAEAHRRSPHPPHGGASRGAAAIGRVSRNRAAIAGGCCVRSARPGGKGGIQEKGSSVSLEPWAGILCGPGASGKPRAYLSLTSPSYCRRNRMIK